MMNRCIVAAILLGLSLGGVVIVPSAEAVDLYYIQGTITDTNGDLLADVTVRDGGQATITDANGTYRLGQLLPGTHTLRASREGCASATEQVTILIPQDTEVDFTLLCDG
jgi:hypothetical protein